MERRSTESRGHAPPGRHGRRGDCTLHHSLDCTPHTLRYTPYTLHPTPSGCLGRHTWTCIARRRGDYNLPPYTLHLNVPHHAASLDTLHHTPITLHATLSTRRGVTPDPENLTSRTIQAPIPALVFFFFTLGTGPRRSLGLKPSDARVYEPQIRARLGTTAHSNAGEAAREGARGGCLH